MISASIFHLCKCFVISASVFYGGKRFVQNVGHSPLRTSVAT